MSKETKEDLTALLKRMGTPLNCDCCAHQFAGRPKQEWNAKCISCAGSSNFELRDEICERFCDAISSLCGPIS